MVKGLPIFKDQIPPCESCILGKHKRTNFPQSSNQAKQHLELVHTELCGPMQTESIGGSFYFLTFIVVSAKKYESIFSDTSLKLLQNSKNSRQKMKNRVVNISKHSGQMEEENTTPENLQFSANHKALSCKQQPGILHNRMEWLKDNNEYGKNTSQREKFVKYFLG
jgi:hypothetical protein